MTLALVQSLPMGVLVWRLDEEASDESLRLVLANDAAARLLALNLRSLVQARAPVREVFPRASVQHLRPASDVARGPGPPRPLGDGVTGGDRIPPEAASRWPSPTAASGCCSSTSPTRRARPARCGT